MTPIESALSKTKNGRRELRRQDLIVSVTEQIWAAMEAAGVSKADLSRMLETSKSNVTQLLSGDRNMTLTTLSDITEVLGLNAVIYLAQPKDEVASVRQRVCEVQRYVTMDVKLTKATTSALLDNPIIYISQPIRARSNAYSAFHAAATV